MLADFLCLIMELAGWAAGKEREAGHGPGACAWIFLIVTMIASVFGALIGLGLLFTGRWIVGLVVTIVGVIAVVGLGQSVWRMRHR